MLCVLLNSAAAGQAIRLQKSTAIGKKLFTVQHGMFDMRAFRCFSFKIPRALDDMCLQRHLFAKRRNTIKGDVNNLCTIGGYPEGPHQGRRARAVSPWLWRRRAKFCRCPGISHSRVRSDLRMGIHDQSPGAGTGSRICGSSFLGLLTRGLIAHGFILSAENGMRISFPASPDWRSTLGTRNF